MIRNLTPEEYEQEKRRIISLMFPIDDTDYVAGQRVAKDKIKNRIDFQMYRDFHTLGNTDIESDVLQDLFEALLKINPKNTKRFVDGYYQHPQSVYYFANYILRIKIFGHDTKYPNKPISTAKKILHTSSISAKNSEIRPKETDDFDGFDDG